MSNMREGWKVWTHDRRSPIQGGKSVWDGTYPTTLATVPLDTSDAECGFSGWHYCADLATALRIGGMWPGGWPALYTQVVGSEDAIERGGKRRASSLVLRRQASEAEIAEAVLRFSAVFGPHAATMAAEQLAWCEALARPLRDDTTVEAGLREALSARGLAWAVKRYKTARAARDVWNTRAIRAAWAAWDARDASDVRAAWDVWAVWDVGAVRSAWNAWDVWAVWDVGDVRSAWNAKAAWDALTVQYASLMGWVSVPRDLLTQGIRDAYRNGLDAALPTGPDELGYAMVEEAPQ